MSTDGVTFETAEMDLETGMPQYSAPDDAATSHYVPPLVPSPTAPTQASPLVPTHDSTPLATPESTLASHPASAAETGVFPPKEQNDQLVVSSPGQILSTASDELHGLD